MSDAEAFAGDADARNWVRDYLSKLYRGHGHFASFGKAMSNLDLNKVDSFQDIAAMVAEAGAKAAPEQVTKDVAGIRANGQDPTAVGQLSYSSRAV